MPQNRLAGETSPYLLQHADNPVDWWPWGAEALAEAQRSGKPILLSVGYAACHWCHVMAHECFEDPAIAAVMNRLFVNIKVDREERPDLDHIYQSALALMGQAGGWPLTMFLTPDGEPFWGGTFFPARPAHGRPGFVEVLEKVSELHESQAETVERNRAAIMAELARLTRSEARPSPLPPQFPERAARTISAHVDPEHGGLGGAPKFPQPFLFELLWRVHLRTGDGTLGDAVIRTLDHLAQGGIYDHLGGGFARYAVDARWQVPHFEKMLYDNALILRLLTLVWQETGSPLHAARIAETIDWLAREMRSDGGAFAASLDADSEGVEGKYYLWSADEIAALLPAADRDLFTAVYDVRRTGNWEGSNILHRLGAMTPRSPEEEDRLARCRRILAHARAERVPPARDDKVLADWNGLAIRALADAAMVFARPDWLGLAETAFAFVVEEMRGPEGRILHAACGGRTSPVSLLDDHAQMIAAALALYESGAGDTYLDHAFAWAETVERLFRDAAGGGYFTAPQDAPALIVRPKTAHDTAQPSANGTMVENFARLFHLTNDDRWKARADAVITAFGGELVRNFLPLAGLLNGADTLAHGFAVRLDGDRDDPRFVALERTLWETSLPMAVRSPPGERGRERDENGPLALICTRGTCGLPLRDSAALGAALRARRRMTS